MNDPRYPNSKNTPPVNLLSPEEEEQLETMFRTRPKSPPVPPKMELQNPLPTRRSIPASPSPEPFRKTPSQSRQSKKSWWGITVFCAVVLIACILLFSLFIGGDRTSAEPDSNLPEWIEVDLLPINEYSRPGKSIAKINGIVVHYTANPGSTAQQNRDYFASLAKNKSTYASSNFIIGLDGEILLAVPMDEVAYCSNERNSDTLSIECCHPDDSGEFTEATYASLVKLCAWLTKQYGLDPATDIIRHYDITGKICPKYFVENEAAFDRFKQAVHEYKPEIQE